MLLLGHGYGYYDSGGFRLQTMSKIKLTILGSWYIYCIFTSMTWGNQGKTLLDSNGYAAWQGGDLEISCIVRTKHHDSFSIACIIKWAHPLETHPELIRRKLCFPFWLMLFEKRQYEVLGHETFCMVQVRNPASSHRLNQNYYSI